ncbi:MAG: hypothetical protein AAGE96_00805 [Cyanobacteria bacterium P01_G01_bin.19]
MKQISWQNNQYSLSEVENASAEKIEDILQSEFLKIQLFNQAKADLPLSLINILGQCKTSEYPTCPNIPNHHLEYSTSSPRYLASTGRYYWLDFKIVDAERKAIAIRIIFNEGDADCNDGFWGAVWETNTQQAIANIVSTGDCETTIEEIPNQFTNVYARYDLENIPRGGFWDIVCANDTQMEQLIALGINVFMSRNN